MVQHHVIGLDHRHGPASEALNGSLDHRTCQQDITRAVREGRYCVIADVEQEYLSSYVHIHMNIHIPEIESMRYTLTDGSDTLRLSDTGRSSPVHQRSNAALLGRAASSHGPGPGVYELRHGSCRSAGMVIITPHSERCIVLYLQRHLLQPQQHTAAGYAL